MNPLTVRRAWPCVLALLSWLCAAHAAHVAVDSKISAVTVYSDRALVSRTASINAAAPGVITVAFEKLPGSIDADSITVTGRGDAPVTILDLTGHETHIDHAANPRVREAEEQLQKLKAQRRGLEDRLGTLKAQEATLTRLEAAATAPPNKETAPRLTIEEAEGLLAFLDRQRTKLAGERASVDENLQELVRKLAAAEATLAELRNSRERSHATVVVRLDARAAGRIDLTLGYVVGGAAWRPSYDVRAESGSHALTLGYFGIVRQNTGEDWTDVAMTLSTARPNLGGEAPKLAMWVLDAPRPVVREAPAMRRDAAKAAGNAAAEKDVVQLEAFMVQSARTSVHEGMTSVSFRVAAPATVLSDNSPQKVPVTTLQLAATPEYLTVPKQLAAAFLTAKITNSSEFPLLAGESAVFLDGSYVASSSIKTVMPAEKFELQLGADEGIAVTHKQVNRFAEDTGITSSGKRVTYEYLITIQNNKRTTERVVVNDQLPISRHEKIVVKQIQPAEREVKPANDGTLTWTLDLKPGEKRELKVKFSVDRPNELGITGLEA